MNGTKLTPSNVIKYLGVFIDEKLNWKFHLTQLSTKLIRANSMLALIRHHVPKQTLLSIYHGVFSSHLNYGCQIWGQAINNNSKIFRLQKKAMRIVTFSEHNSHTGPIFKELKILKLPDIIKFYNCILVKNVLKRDIPAYFLNFFKLSSEGHNHNTRDSSNGTVTLPTIRTTTFGRNSIRFQSAIIWNQTLNELVFSNTNEQSDNQCIKNLDTVELKHLLKENFLNLYH